MAEEKKDKSAVKTERKVTAVKVRKEKVKLGTRLKKFFKDYRSEIKKIVWPTRAQVIKNTGIVLVAIIFIAAIVGVLDLVFGLGINALSSLGRG